MGIKAFGVEGVASKSSTGISSVKVPASLQGFGVYEKLAAKSLASSAVAGPMHSPTGPEPERAAGLLTTYLPIPLHGCVQVCMCAYIYIYMYIYTNTDNTNIDM